MNENETDFRKDTKIIIYPAHWIVPFSYFALVLKWISTNHLHILRDASEIIIECTPNVIALRRNDGYPESCGKF